MRRRIAAGVLVAVTAVAVAYRPVRAHLRAAAVLSQLADPSARPWFLPSPDRIEESDGTFAGPNGAPTPARWYRPIGIAHPRGMLVLHGVHRLGIHDPRLAVFARALASSGVAVMTPQITPLTEYRVDTEGIDIIGAAAVALANSSDVAPGGVDLVGTSFAGGLALMVAADARFAARVREVLAIGAYDDLERVGRFLATDEAISVDGPPVHLVAHEYGALILAHSHPDEFFPAADVERAREVLRLWLREEKEAAMKAAAQLTREGHVELDRLLHDRAAVRGQLLASISRHASEMAAASPHGHLASLQVPVFLLHGSEDTVIPPTETGWLAHDLPSGTLRGELVTPLLEHVSLQGTHSLRERWQAVHFLAGVIAAE